MSDKKKLISLSVLGVIAISILAASPAQANGWGWRGGHDHSYRKHHRYDRHYGHYRHHDRHGSYGKIVIDLPGKYFRVIIGGKRYYHCNGEYYRRNGRYFELVPSPYGSSVARRDYYDRD